MEDIEGFVTVAKGSANVAIGGQVTEFVSATVAGFAGSGPGGALQFGEFNGVAQTENVTKLKEANFGLSGGVAYAFGGDEESHTQGYQAKAVPAEQIIVKTSVSDFATGSSKIP